MSILEKFSTFKSILSFSIILLIVTFTKGEQTKDGNPKFLATVYLAICSNELNAESNTTNLTVSFMDMSAP